MTRYWLPTTYEDPNSDWNNEANAYDDDTGTYSESDDMGQWDEAILILEMSSEKYCNGIDVYNCTTSVTTHSYFEIDIWKDGSWSNVFSGYSGGYNSSPGWSRATFDLQLVSKMRLKWYSSEAATYKFRCYEARFVLKNELARFDNINIQKYEDILYFKKLQDTPQFTITQSDVKEIKKLVYSTDYIKNDIVLTGGVGWCGEYKGPTVSLSNKKRADRRYYNTFKPTNKMISRIRIPISGGISSDYNNDTVYFRWGGWLHKCGFLLTQSGNKLYATLTNTGNFTNPWNSINGTFFKPTYTNGTYVTVPQNGSKQIDYHWSGSVDIDYIHTNLLISSNHANGKVQVTWRFNDNYGNYKDFNKLWSMSGNGHYLTIDEPVNYTGVSSASLILSDNDGGGTHFCSFDCAGLLTEGFDETKIYNSTIGGNLPILHYPIGLVATSKECRGWEEIEHYKAYLSGSEEGLFEFPDNPALDINKYYIFEWTVVEASNERTDGYTYDGFTDKSGNVLIYYLSNTSSNSVDDYRLYYSDSPMNYGADNIGTSGSNLDSQHTHCNGLAMQIGYGNERMRVQKENSNSIKHYGRCRYTKAYPHMDYRGLNVLAEKISNKYASGNWTGSFVIQGKPEIELGQKFNLYLEKFDISGTYEIGGYTHRISGKKGFTTEIELSTPKYDVNEDIVEVYKKERL